MPTPSILVAEDEQPIADVLVALLGDEGYAVRHARDGAVALAMIERDPPDLLISNVAMPYVDGIQLARRVTDRLNPIPVVLVSAQVDAVDLPGVVFVAKPFDLDHIVALVGRLLDGRAVAGTAGDGG